MGMHFPGEGKRKPLAEYGQVWVRALVDACGPLMPGWYPNQTGVPRWKWEGVGSPPSLLPDRVVPNARDRRLYYFYGLFNSFHFCNQEIVPAAVHVNPPVLLLRCREG